MMKITSELYGYNSVYEYLRQYLHYADEINKENLTEELNAFTFTTLKELETGMYIIYSGDAAIVVEERSDGKDFVVAVKKSNLCHKIIVNHIVFKVSDLIDDNFIDNEEDEIRHAIIREVQDNVNTINCFSIIRELAEKDPEELRNYEEKIGDFTSIEHLVLDLAEELLFSEALIELSLMVGVNID